MKYNSPTKETISVQNNNQKVLEYKSENGKSLSHWCVCVCVCVFVCKSLPVKEGGRERVHCTMSPIAC